MPVEKLGDGQRERIMQAGRLTGALLLSGAFHATLRIYDVFNPRLPVAAAPNTGWNELELPGIIDQQID